MIVYDLIATEEHFDMKTGLITYKVKTRDGQAATRLHGLIVLGPLGADRDMAIMNPVYNGGELEVKMRPLRTPAKKYKIEEVVAQLVVP